MNAQERFECYTSEIEKMAEKSECLKPNDIAEELISSHGIGIRDINAVFTFLTESSLIYYIRERQMMAAYKAIISSEKFNAEVGISITGYSDQSAFGKAFKQRFGITPKEAFEKKDLSKYIEKLTWDALAKDAVLFEHTEIKVKPVKMRFGISEEQYRIANYAADLQVLFDLDDYQSEKAFEFAGIMNLDMKLAFEFISEYCLCFPFDKELSLSKSSFLMDAAHIYCNVVPNIYTAWNLIDVIKKFGYNVSDFSYDFLRMYVKYSNLPIRRIVDWAEDHNCGICHFDDIEEEIQEHIDDIVEGVLRVMKGAPEKLTGPDGLPLPPYAVYNIGGGTPENLLDYISTLQEELVNAGVLPSDYDFEGHRELVGMQPGDVPVTYADSEALERDYGFTPKIGIQEGLRSFAEWYKEYYSDGN